MGRVLYLGECCEERDGRYDRDVGRAEMVLMN